MEDIEKMHRADMVGKQSGYGGQTKPIFHKKAKTVCSLFIIPLLTSPSYAPCARAGDSSLRHLSWEDLQSRSPLFCLLALSYS